MRGLASGSAGADRRPVRMPSTRAAATTKDPASRKKGAAIAAANRRLPTGGPTNSWDVIWAAYKRLFASSRRSRGATAGIRAWAALSNRVSPVPRTKATTTSKAILVASKTTAAARPSITSARPVSTCHITRRRSTRSTTAPLTRLNSSQGRLPARVTAATAPGSRVMLAASNGRAANRTPSPRFDTAAAAHSLL